MVEVAISLILAAHLLCVNVATAGPLVCLWCEWREARGDALAGHVGRFLAKSAIILFGVGMLLGLCVGAMVWSDKYLAVLSYLKSKVLFGIAELAFSLVLMMIYLLWWNRARSSRRGVRICRAALPLLAGTNLLYHFPLLFVTVSNLTQLESVPNETLTAAGFRQLIMQGEIIARVLHFAFASFAITGVLLIWHAWRLMKMEGQMSAKRIALWGGRIAFVPTVMQLPTGLWLMLELPENVIGKFMGGSLIASALLATSLLAVLWLMHQLSVVAFGGSKPQVLLGSIIATLIVVLLMTGTLRAAKSPRSTGTVDEQLTRMRHDFRPGPS